MDINIKGLTKSYGVQKAVDDISFHVKTGEILGFLGPNGAGKSTTMKMITGYLGIEHGSIEIGGQNISDNYDEIKKHIGYLPENNPLYLDMPVLDYLQYCALLVGMSKADIPGRIKEMVGMCGLNREKHKKIGELSKGYRQRVGLAQAMIHDPDILILDEPTTGLDPNQIVEIRKLIRDLGKEKTVILSTHILPEVEATCDRILIINRGRIVADGSADSLRKQAQGGDAFKVCIEDATDHMALLYSIKQLPSVADVDFAGRDTQIFNVRAHADTHVQRDIFNLCVQNKWVLTEITPLETKLEDIFRHVTMN